MMNVESGLYFLAFAKSSFKFSVLHETLRTTANHCALRVKKASVDFRLKTAD